jgi:tetratricopeptide (TPR) repeat protein
LALATDLKADHPTQAAGYLLEASARTAARRYTAAADSLATAFDREPTWPILTRMVEALRLAGRPEDGLRATRRGLRPPATRPRRITARGLLQDAGRNEEALRAYEATLRLDEENVATLNNAAWLSHGSADPALCPGGARLRAGRG